MSFRIAVICCFAGRRCIVYIILYVSNPLHIVSSSRFYACFKLRVDPKRYSAVYSVTAFLRLQVTSMRYSVVCVTNIRCVTNRPTDVRWYSSWSYKAYSRNANKNNFKANWSHYGPWHGFTSLLVTNAPISYIICTVFNLPKLFNVHKSFFVLQKRFLLIPRLQRCNAYV
jgi:hypothetical protein